MKRGFSAESPSASRNRLMAVLEIYKRVPRPKPLLEVLACYQFAWPFQQHHQNFEWLPLEFDSHSALPEFARAQVDFESSESNNPWPLGGFRCHGKRFAPPSVSPPERIR